VKRSLAVLLVIGCAACPAASATPRGDSPTPRRDAAAPSTLEPAREGAAAGLAPDSTGEDAPRDDLSQDEEPRDIGPFTLSFLPHRNVFLTTPSFRTTPATPTRLLANLHGLCNPPEYACGYWMKAASEVAFLVCPEGNARCGGSENAPPTWTESFEGMDADLEKAVAATEASFPSEMTRDGAVLTGFSRGAYAAAAIALRHPGRWPYLVLVEGDVTLTVPMLERAHVRSVAMLAGEWGTQLAGSKKTCETLGRRGYPARFIVMPKAGHYYSADIDERMREALAFVLAH
jgi:predicted esterase